MCVFRLHKSAYNINTILKYNLEEFCILNRNINY